METHRIYRVSFASIYPLYIQKVVKKGYTKADADQIIHWLTGYTQAGLESQIAKGASLEVFYNEAPRMNPTRRLITGTVCGVRVEKIKDPLMQEIRYLDKLIDELARGKHIEKILRPRAKVESSVDSTSV